MPAGVYNLVVEQGATYARTFSRQTPNEDGTSSPASLGGRQARMQIRRRRGGTVMLSLDSAAVQPTHASLVLDDAAGTIQLYIGATLTDTFTAGGVYDLELYDPNNPDTVERLLTGNMTVSKQVTTA